MTEKKSRKMKTGIKALALAGAMVFGLLGTSTSSSAATLCAADLLDNVVANSGCQIGSDNNDSPIPGQVNTDEMFGPLDWSGLGKVEPGPGSNGGLTIGGSALAGTFSISNAIWSLYSEIMLVFKGGNGNINPDDYVGYMLASQSGTFESPFVNGNNGGTASISHWSLYGRGGPRDNLPPVPLPAALPLLLTGLIGLGFLGRRRRKAV